MTNPAAFRVVIVHTPIALAATDTGLSSLDPKSRRGRSERQPLISGVRRLVPKSGTESVAR